MKKLLFFFVTLFLLISCSDDKNSEVICTRVFGCISWKVEYKNGNAVSLDSLKVYLNGKDITFERDFYSFNFKQNRIKGEYVISNDNQRDIFRNKIEKVNVVGYKGLVEVFNREIEIGADECHIYSPGNENAEKIVINNDLHVCTEQFETVPLKIVSKEGLPVALDYYSVALDYVEYYNYDVEFDKTDVTLVKDFNSQEYKRMQEAGSYPIVDDSLWENFQNKVVVVVFKGYKNGVEICKEWFYIGADDCHVTYLGGDPLTVILE